MLFTPEQYSKRINLNLANLLKRFAKGKGVQKPEGSSGNRTREHLNKRP